MKYEKSPRMVNEVPTQAGPSTESVQRLFEAHTVASKTKQKEPKASARPLQPVHQLQRAKPATIVEEQMIEKTEPRPARVKVRIFHLFYQFYQLKTVCSLPMLIDESPE